MFGLFALGQPSPIPTARLHRIERKLDLILSHLGLEFADDLRDGLPNEVKELADAGRKIEAIKVHRELLGSGLKQAKDEVEAYMGQK